MNKNINSRIQSLRGIAFLLIFFSHCVLFYNGQGENLLRWLGGLGVEIFIVLSGYLAFKYFPKDIDYWLYCKRKIKRFIPLHWLSLILAIPFCLPITIETIGKILINAMLLQVWIPKAEVYFSLNAVSWYLGITLYFIIITPVLIKKIISITPYKAIILLVAIQLFEVLIVFAINYMSIDSHWLVYICPVTRSLDFLAGGVLYILSFKNKTAINLQNLRILGWLLGVIILFFSFNTVNEIFSTAIWFFPTILIVYGTCEQVCLKKNLLSKLGDISFELFLFHQLVINYVCAIFRRIVINNRIIIFFISILLSIIISYVYKVTTQRMQRNK